MRKLVMIAAPLALMLAAPAQAGVSEGAMACPSQEAPAGLGASLIDLVIAGDTKSSKVAALFEKLEALGKSCAKKHNVPKELEDSYGNYVFDMVTRDEVTQRLRSHNVPVEAIDEALGYGPGLANPVIKDIKDSHFNKISAAMRLRGYDLGKAPEAVFELIGIYIGARSGLVEDMAALD